MLYKNSMKLHIYASEYTVLVHSLFSMTVQRLPGRERERAVRETDSPPL